jgi:hypothetical protein
MPRVDQLDAHVFATHEEGVKVSTMKAKCNLDSDVPKALCKQISASNLACPRVLEVEAGHCE